MPKPDYSTWLTKQQAADAIGASTKLIERLADEKQIQHARSPGGCRAYSLTAQPGRAGVRDAGG
jgi:hypothetical protein